MQSSSDRWLDYLFTKPSFNSEGSETKRLRHFRPLFHKLTMETRAHKIILDCTSTIFRIKTSKTAFSWLKTLNTFGCNRQGTEKTLKERTLSISIIHARTSLQQKRKQSWLSRRVGSWRKEPNCGLGSHVKDLSREKFFVSLPWNSMHSTRAWILEAFEF